MIDWRALDKALCRSTNQRAVSSHIVWTESSCDLKLPIYTLVTTNVLVDSRSWKFVSFNMNK